MSVTTDKRTNSIDNIDTHSNLCSLGLNLVEEKCQWQLDCLQMFNANTLRAMCDE